MADDRDRPPATRRQQQKSDTRHRILEAARSLFEQHGFDDTKMRTIAAEAGVATGTIFTHFSDKGALLISAILEDLAETDRRIAETLPPSPIRAQIHHMAKAGFGYWCRRPSLSATLLREMYFIGGPPADHRREETVRFVGFCQELLERARDRGELRTGVDLGAVARGMYAAYVGRLIQAAGDGDFDLDRMLSDLDVFVDCLLTGIGVPSDRPL